MFSSNTTQVSNPVYIEDVFSTWLYTGNGSTQTITNNIDLSTKGGMVWLKDRSAAASNLLYDTIRGAGKVIGSPTTGAQVTNTTGQDLTAFTSTGFSLGPNEFGTNTSSETYAAWTFRKQPKFFDVVTYTGNGIAGRQISHNLGSTPGCIIVKCTSNAGTFWSVYHRSSGATNLLRLNTTDAAVTSTQWDNTAPTSTVFTVGTAATVNQDTYTYVAYLFAHDAGGFGLTGTDNVISCGTWTGVNAEVTLGWEPQWVLSKRSNSATVGAWELCDNMRGMPAAPGAENYLLANTTAAEVAGGYNFVTPTATGFKTSTTGAGVYIYIAIRRGPMKVPTDGTKVFSPQTASGIQTTNFPVDFDLGGPRAGGVELQYAYDRLRGGTKYLIQTTTLAEQTGGSSLGFDSNTGVTSSWPSGYINWYFQRAPSFFDEVCYTGTGSARTVTHNLGVAPELMIIKSRVGTSDWLVYSSGIGATKRLQLNDTSASFTQSVAWNDTAPTSSLFTVGTSGAVNGSGSTYVAYLFATCAGVSKVGSYTGNGTSQTIDCGFAAGARFVLVKRTDGAGGWAVWDTARGMVSGNDPYLYLNSTAAEVTSTDYVDTTSVGFIIKGTGFNNTGETYIFLAIA